LSWPFGSGQWDELEKTADGTIMLPGKEKIRYETHMMIEDPRACGILLARAGIARVMAHAEAFDSTDDAHGALDAWKHAGAKEVGLALLIDTPFAMIEPLISKLDCVLLMSIAALG